MSVRFGVIGVAHFAASHIKYLEELDEKEQDVELTAVCIRNPDKYAEEADSLRSRGIEVVSSLDEFLTSGREYIDVVTVPTSIYSHAPLSVRAMRSGFDVMCEKPPAPTIQDIDEMIRTSEETSRFCAIGFQNIYSYSIRRLKKMLLDGELGQLREMACKAYWPRFKSYYDRNVWAGEFAVDGEYVLDGPINNALAHYLYNMLYLAGEEMDEAAEPRSVKAELYRGHTYINAEDTSCIRIETDNGVKIHFYVTHCSEENVDPIMEIETSQAAVEWHFNQDTRIEKINGETITFGSGNIDRHKEVFHVAARTANKELDRPYCDVHNTRPFVLSINSAYESSGCITPIPEQYVREFYNEDEEYQTLVEDIEEIMDEAFRERKLLSEIDVPWARATQPFAPEDYSEFNLKLKGW